jgi:hypothetical protein
VVEKEVGGRSSGQAVAVDSVVVEVVLVEENKVGDLRQRNQRPRDNESSIAATK